MDIQNLLISLSTKPPHFTVADASKGVFELNYMQQVMQLIIYHYEHDEYEEKADVIEGIHSAISSVITGGNEPTFDNGHCWGYPVLCASICMLKNKADLWEAFSEDEHNRLDLVMHMFALMWNFGCNKGNSFSTGIGLKRNYSKTWIGNYQLTNNILIPYIIEYFGSEEAVNNLFLLEHTDVVNKLTQYNFTNALSVWNRPERHYADGTIAPSAEFLYGYRAPTDTNKEAYKLLVKDTFQNNVRAGYGSGCRIPLGYIHPIKKTRLNLKDELILSIFNDCFNGGECVSRVFIEFEDAYVECDDSKASPYEGQVGMMSEFKFKDAGGTRSSLWHCEIDFMLMYMHVLAFKYLNIFDISTTEEWNKIKVGMNDFVFKKQNNYRGYSMGNYENDLKPLSSDFWINKWCEEMEEII